MKCWWLTILLALSVVGCAQTAATVPTALPLKVSMLPPEPDWNAVLPAAVELKPNPGLPTYEDTTVPSKTYCTSVKPPACLPSGILVSENTYAQIVANESTLKRTTKELALRTLLRTQEHAYIQQGELLYQQRIVELQNENAKLRQPSWWENAKPYLAFTLGVGVTVLTTFAVTQSTK